MVTQYNYTPPQSNADKLKQAYIAQAQWKKMLDSAKVGSADYNKALKQYKALSASIKTLQEATNAEIGATKATENKAARQKLVDKLTRVTDSGTAAEIQAAKDALNKFDGKTTATTTTATTTNATTSTVVDKNKNGIPDNIESADAKAKAEAAAKAKADAAAKAEAEKSAAAKAIADQAVKDKELALKTMYVDYLRSTFAGLEDKKQKAEIDALFDKASKEGWTAENFQMALEGTSWWQTTLPSLRSWYLDTHDPRKQSTTVELIRNKVASVSSYLEQLGLTVQGIDPVTGKAFDKTGYVSGIAQEAVKNGWNDNQLRDYLAGQAAIVFTGGGEIGSSLSKIRDTAYAYGVNLDPTYEKMINNSLLDSSDGRDANYYIAEMRRQAIENPNNKAFYEALNSGRTLYEATRSYRGQMANLLEVDESNVTWNDLMKKTIDSTTGAARTFADFTKEVKSDPLWQQTRNAKETYSSKALDLAKMFGLVG